MKTQNEIKDKATVVSIWSRLVNRTETENKPAEEKESVPAESFLDVMRKNQQTQKRLEQERLKANQQVLKSYKIKT